MHRLPFVAATRMLVLALMPGMSVASIIGCKEQSESPPPAKLAPGSLHSSADQAQPGENEGAMLTGSDASRLKTPSKTGTGPSAASAAAHDTQGSVLEVRDPDGSVLELQKDAEASAYRIRRKSGESVGEKIGKVKIGDDRVKVLDAAGKERVKIKQKPEGFKIYGPDDAVLWKVKQKGELYSVRNADDVEKFRVGPQDLTQHPSFDAFVRAGLVVYLSTFGGQ